MEIGPCGPLGQHVACLVQEEVSIIPEVVAILSQPMVVLIAQEMQRRLRVVTPNHVL